MPDRLSNDLPTLGSIIQPLRERHGISREAASEGCQLTVGQYRTLEDTKSKKLWPAHVLANVCGYYDLNKTDLLRRLGYLP